MLNTQPVCFTCKREYPADKLTLVEPGSFSPLPQEPLDPESEEWAEWNELPRVTVCPKRHLVASNGRPRIAAMLVGDTEAGKDAMLNAVIHELQRKAIDARGLHGVVREDQRSAWRATEPSAFNRPATKQSTRSEPVQPLFLELVDRSHRAAPVYDIIYFNHGGEDFLDERSVQVSTKTVWDRCFGLADADIIIFVVPPRGLLDLPADRGGTADPDLRYRTRDTVDVVARTLRKNRPQAKDLTVVIVLSKADHYRHLDGFPQHVLDPRRHSRNRLEPLDITMANEQSQLFDFMVKYGGSEITEAARSINGRYYITAVSGTGSDTKGKAASPGYAPDRSLDPLLIRMMREGIGRLTAADLEESRKA